MNNLTQKQRDAKQAYLDKQLEQMLSHYKDAGKDELKAIIRQIDDFLPVKSSKSERVFWLKFRQKIERQIEQTA